MGIAYYDFLFYADIMDWFTYVVLWPRPRSLFKVFQATIVSSQSTKNYNVCVQSVQQTYLNYVPFQDFNSPCDFLCGLF